MPRGVYFRTQENMQAFAEAWLSGVDVKTEFGITDRQIRRYRKRCNLPYKKTLSTRQTTTAIVGPEDRRLVVTLKSPLSKYEYNLLFAVGEGAGCFISWDDLCFRLNSSLNSVRVAATKLRKKLQDEWSLQSKNNKGLRIVRIIDV
jgi:hypothetical protein